MTDDAKHYPTIRGDPYEGDSVCAACEQEWPCAESVLEGWRAADAAKAALAICRDHLEEARRQRNRADAALTLAEYRFAHHECDVGAIAIARDAARADTAEVLLAGSHERTSIVLKAKDEWMARALKAEAALAEMRADHLVRIPDIEVQRARADKAEAALAGEQVINKMLREMAENAIFEKDVAVAREKALLDVHPFDDEHGMCLWCAGGWEQVQGPRGGKGKYVNTGKHRDNCPFAASLAAHT